MKKKWFPKSVKSFQELGEVLTKYKQTRTKCKYGEIAEGTAVVIDDIGRDYYRVRYRGNPIYLPNWVLDG